MAEKQSFEDNMRRLEEIVRMMEEGQGSLEESIRAYEEGMRLCKACGAELEECQRRIRQIDPQSGAEKPFEEGNADE